MTSIISYKPFGKLENYLLVRPCFLLFK